jgi:hypothetical protein
VEGRLAAAVLQDAVTKDRIEGEARDGGDRYVLRAKRLAN